MKDLPPSIVGKRVLLVNYLPSHVPVYHSWMEDPEIRDLTASERLTLDQEYEMQQTWTNDPNKCTFIVFDRTGQDAIMAGDVNLFLEGPVAEIDIMIAEKRCRGKGLGIEAVKMMMQFGASRLGISKFVAKIASHNHASLSLFKKLGYVEVAYEEAFDEHECEFVVGYCGVPDCWQYGPCLLHEEKSVVPEDDPAEDAERLRPFLCSFKQLLIPGETERVKSRIDKVFGDQILIVQDMLRGADSREVCALKQKLVDKESEKRRVIRSLERQLAAVTREDRKSVV